MSQTTKGQNATVAKRTIGTIGAGEVAQAFAVHLLKAGHEVLLSNSRGPSSLTQVVSKLGKVARAVKMDEAVLGKFPDWEGRILIDATNHFLLPSMELADLKGRVSSETSSADHHTPAEAAHPKLP